MQLKLRTILCAPSSATKMEQGISEHKKSFFYRQLIAVSFP